MTAIEQTPDALFANAVTALSAVDEPWSVLFFLAKCEETPSHSPPPPSTDATNQAVQLIRTTSAAVESAALISANDYLEEISTRSIKFLLLPYLAARALQTWQGEQEDRLQKLLEARRELLVFFTSMDQLKLLSEQDRERVLDESIDVVLTPSQQREQKIARFKQEKEAERKLKIVLQRSKTRTEHEDDDDDDEREAALIVLESAVRRALDMIMSIDQELEILKYAAKQRARGIDPREKAERTRPKGPPAGMGGLPPTFRIVSEREKLKEGVFKPSHSLPTYTIEEWGEIEMQRAMQAEAEKRNADIVKARRAEEEDSDGDEAVNRETMEKRRWDDWADEHNKGSGNSLR